MSNKPSKNVLKASREIFVGREILSWEEGYAKIIQSAIDAATAELQSRADALREALEFYAGGNVTSFLGNPVEGFTFQDPNATIGVPVGTKAKEAIDAYDNKGEQG